MKRIENPATFGTLAAVVIVTGIVSSLGAPLVPAIAEQQHISLATAQWVLTIALIAGAVATPAMGRLGSGRLRRRVVLIALTAVLIGTVVSALPLGLSALLFGRALQGIGMALAPLSLAAARDIWSGKLLLGRLAWLSVAAVSGAGLGYPVTSFVAAHTSVSGAYWFGAILVLITLAFATRFFPDATPRLEDGHGIDTVGTVLLGFGTAGFLLAVSNGESWGWTSATTPTVAIGSLVVLAGWVRWTIGLQRRGGNPLVDLRVAALPGVQIPNIVSFVVGVGIYGMFSLSIIVVQADVDDGFGLGGGVALGGMVLVPYAVVSISGNRFALALAAAGRTAILLPAGCLTFSLSLASLAIFHDALWQVLLAMAVAGFGGGFTFSSMAMLMVPHLPAQETSAALAFNQLLRYLGFSTGAALAITLLDLYGGGGQGFRAAVLTEAAICLAAAVIALLGEPRGGRAIATAPIPEQYSAGCDSCHKSIIINRLD